MYTKPALKDVDQAFWCLFLFEFILRCCFFFQFSLRFKEGPVVCARRVTLGQTLVWPRSRAGLLEYASPQVLSFADVQREVVLTHPCSVLDIVVIAIAIAVKGGHSQEQWLVFLVAQTFQLPFHGSSC